MWIRRIGALLFAVLLVAACGAAGPSAPPTSAIPITMPHQAWAAVVATEPRFAGIPPQDPSLIGQSAWYEVDAASGVGAYVVRVTIGWGDCPAGCIDRHVWTLAVSPEGVVTLLSEEGPPVPAGALS